MAATKKKPTIEALLEQGDWDAARTQIENSLAKKPDSHWLITQLGVTYYEQRQYEVSVRYFQAALKIVSDCPLTLWNLAGALEAIGKSKQAIPIYVWILRSNLSAKDDPCWESAEWTEGLKTDCVYRLGLCFQHRKRWKSAEHCFRQYFNLLLAGMKGLYSIEDAMRHLREVQANRQRNAKKDLKEAIDSTLHDPGVQSLHGARGVPKLSIEELLAI